MHADGYTLEVDEDGICLLRSPWDPALRRAIRAIPGRFWDEDLRGWTIRLTPDRAESIARLLRSFPVFEADRERLPAHQTHATRGMGQFTNDFYCKFR